MAKLAILILFSLQSSLAYSHVARGALSRNFITLGLTSSRSVVICADDGGMSWQEELEQILSPGTASSDREVLFRDLLGRSGEIVGEIRDAVSSGDLKSLVPPSTEGARVLDDLESVKRQVVEDLMPQAATTAQSLISDPAVAASKLSESLQQAPTLAQDAAQVSSALFQDPARLAALVQQEARNVVSRTPEGLEMPSYEVVSSTSDYEVRIYESCGVALASLGAGSSAIESEGSIRGFNALVAYVLGANAGAEQLEWTAPVRTDVSDDGFGEMVEMSVMLPRRYTSSTAPAPTDTNILLRQTEVQTLAIAEFSGLATAGEVSRQLAALRGVLARDGLECATLPDGLTYSVLQYNPPYTLPWLRRNEIAVPVVMASGEEAVVEVVEEAAEETTSADESTGEASGAEAETAGEAAWLDAPSD